MIKMDIKSLAAGIVIGTVGITTVFAATGIKSARLSSTAVTLNGEALVLENPLVLVAFDTFDDGQDEVLYVPAKELLGKLGYIEQYDDVKDTINIIPGNQHLLNVSNEAGLTGETVLGENSINGDMVIHLTNHTGQKNIAESGSFLAEDNQKLILTIASDIQGGTVDFFFFAPDGKEQRITIGAGDVTKEIPLEKGVWQYNCSGMFVDGGKIKIVGVIQ